MEHECLLSSKIPKAILLQSFNNYKIHSNKTLFDRNMNKNVYIKD